MFIDKLLCGIVDSYFALRPQKHTHNKKIAKIVSHRGVHDNVTVFENTINAFDNALNCGAWGIELDIRFTKDSCPVVIHDNNCKRLFGENVRVDAMTITELKERFLLIPTLAEVIHQYENKLHLMVELKTELYKDEFSKILYEHFVSLRPCVDFHILSLNCDMFNYVGKFPSATFLPVAEKNVRHMSRRALENNYGGITGHYFLLNQKILKSHLAAGQSIGTGFISSENCLHRELNRGVEWIFTNANPASL